METLIKFGLSGWEKLAARLKQETWMILKYIKTPENVKPVRDSD